MPHHTTISIYPEAPLKPKVGASCNGCGVCCLLEPCPLGVVLSGRKTGACDAVRWNSAHQVYRCGAVTEPKDVLNTCLPRGLKGLSPALALVLRRFAPRWIAAAAGCDCNVEVVLPAERPLSCTE